MQANKNLVTTKTTMRYAFEAGLMSAMQRGELSPAAQLVAATDGKRGVSKTTSWKVTRRGGR